MEKNSQTTTEQVVNTILKGIQKGTFGAGQKLPSQRELSEMFGVSRMVIREAVKILEGKDIVFSRKGSGIFVKQGGAEIGNQSPGMISISDYSLRDIYTLSSVIVQSCADLVIENATDEELREMHVRIQDMYDNYGSNTTLQVKYIYETTFGITICKLTHNELLYKIMVEMLNVTSETDYQLIKNIANYRSIIEIDLLLLEALMNRDSYRAKFLSYERETQIRKVIQSGSIQ